MVAPHPASVGWGFAWAPSHTVIDPVLIGCDDDTFGFWGGEDGVCEDNVQYVIILEDLHCKDDCIFDDCFCYYILLSVGLIWTYLSLTIFMTVLAEQLLMYFMYILKYWTIRKGRWKNAYLTWRLYPLQEKNKKIKMKEKIWG